MSVHNARKRSVLDVAAEVLVADPAASLAEVAEAAGIGRTTLHKQYATRDDLMRAVGHRVIDLWQQAIDGVADGPDGGLRAATEALVPIGTQLAFLWRNPIFDRVDDINERWLGAEQCGLFVLKRAQSHGILSSGVPDWWLLQTFYSLIYVASQSVAAGQLARLDAPDLVLTTMLHGIGVPPPKVPLEGDNHE